MISPAVAVRQAGGVCAAGRLRDVCRPTDIRRAVADGSIVLMRRGWYGVPGIARAQRDAVALAGVISHLSAAQQWGWELKRSPDLTQLTLPRGRRLSTEQRTSVGIHWVDGVPATTSPQGARVTPPLRTAVDCLRTLPFDEALAVADSALRSGRVTRAALFDACVAAPRIGRSHALRAAAAADARAANPFESVLRAICLGVPGLDVRPQVQLGPYRVDLCDSVRRVVVEAESWAWHSGPDEFAADVRRYTAIVCWGALVVRFSYHEVMEEPAYVAARLRDAVALTNGRTHRSPREGRRSPPTA